LSITVNPRRVTPALFAIRSQSPPVSVHASISSSGSRQPASRGPLVSDYRKTIANHDEEQEPSIPAVCLTCDRYVPNPRVAGVEITDQDRREVAGPSNGSGRVVRRTPAGPPSPRSPAGGGTRPRRRTSPRRNLAGSVTTILARA
jgi:hypothetical protein